MRLVFSFFIVFLFSACTVQQIQSTLDDYLDAGSLTKEDVAEGLKEALVKGIVKGADKASQNNGYLGNPQIRIPFPPDVQRVEDKLRAIGLGNQVDQFVETLNHGAEEAAREAAPIFMDAIRSMTIADAWEILNGNDQAATNYLKKVTYEPLKSKFSPVIAKALEKTNATKYYGDIITTYNRIPLVEDVNPDLNAYATERALEGLFLLVAEEEKNIRDNPGARTTELLRRVFKEQD